MASSRRFSTREEANAHHLLFASQALCAQEIRETIENIAGAKYTPGEYEALPAFQERIYSNHQNQTFLIDGQRGSGKTSLLLKLLDHWQNPKSSNSDDNLEAGAWRGDPEQRTRNIVPLRIIDLQTIPDNGQLLIKFAQVFRLVCEAIFDRGKERPHYRREGRSWEKWQGFFRAAGLSTSGGLRARSASLDPENMVNELQETARNFLDVRPAFYEFMDALGADYRDWKGLGGDPLFVLPIDDADMCPQRSAELLHLLRLIWHPRLVFLLTGDSKLFRTSVRAHYLGLLRADLQKGRLFAEELQSLDDLDRSLILAEEILDKAIPVNQRYRIGDVEPRFAFAMLGAPEEVHSAEMKAPTLPAQTGGSSLSKPRVSLGPLKFNTFQKAKELGPTPDESWTESSLWFYMTHDRQLSSGFFSSIRSVTDLAAGLSHLEQPGVPDVVEQLWKVALTRSTAPRVGVIRDAVRAVSPSPRNASKGKALVVDPTCVEWDPITAADRSLVYGTRLWPEYYLMRTTGFRARATAAHDPKLGSSDALLNPAVAGVLMLATDVVADHAEWRVSRMPAVGSRSIPLVQLDYHSQGRTACFRWPTPDWPAFIDGSMLLDAWNRLIDDLNPVDLAVENLLRHFLLLVTSVAVNRFVPEPLGEPSEDKLLSKLEDLDKQTNTKGPKDTQATRTYANRRWRRSLWLLEKPEYGLSEMGTERTHAVLTPLLGPRPTGKDDELFLLDVRLRYAMRALAVGGAPSSLKDAQELLREIDDRAPPGPSGKRTQKPSAALRQTAVFPRASKGLPRKAP